MIILEQALLLSERQAAEEAKKVITDSEARNAELTKKLEDSERKVDQLQESVQRFVDTSDTRTIILSNKKLYLTQLFPVQLSQRGRPYLYMRCLKRIQFC